MLIYFKWLNQNLTIIGKLEDLAPNEQIYSARFIGKRCYIVTFKKVDPLFVISLENPEDPRILGKLKIPGYSNYLHPYSDSILIGIGKETPEATFMKDYLIQYWTARLHTATYEDSKLIKDFLRGLGVKEF